MKSITESSSLYDGLDQMSTTEILTGINQEDQKVALSIKKIIPFISNFIDIASQKLINGGRLFYIGAGTSGRLGIVDASECPPTFGVDHDLVVGIIAGGDQAIRKAVEFAEDDLEQGWSDLLAYKISDKDVLVGIAASGRTPYVIGAINKANEKNIVTGCITCNPESELAKISQFKMLPVVGPEFVTGSTRMKSGTAQKLILNMISTGVMIKMGKVKGNKMVDMQLSNHKLVERGVQMILEEINVSRVIAESLLKADQYQVKDLIRIRKSALYSQSVVENYKDKIVEAWKDEDLKYLADLDYIALINWTSYTEQQKRKVA
jgi:N-acetylmuramic acid 6-phosphate etherase